MGTCTALYAAKSCDALREPVVLVERDLLAAGASGRTSAIVHQGFADRTMAGMARDPPPAVRLVIAAQAL
jgi:glycine/D-amino acid oxidase-like deaminating enzyme